LTFLLKGNPERFEKICIEVGNKKVFSLWQAGSDVPFFSLRLKKDNRVQLNSRPTNNCQNPSRFSESDSRTGQIPRRAAQYPEGEGMIPDWASMIPAGEDMILDWASMIPAEEGMIPG